MSRVDYGHDLGIDDVKLAFRRQVCPRCGRGTTSLVSTSESPLTLDRRERCYWNGMEVAHGFKCNNRGTGKA